MVRYATLSALRHHEVAPQVNRSLYAAYLCCIIIFLLFGNASKPEKCVQHIFRTGMTPFLQEMITNICFRGVGIALLFLFCNEGN